MTAPHEAVACSRLGSQGRISGPAKRTGCRPSTETVHPTRQARSRQMRLMSSYLSRISLVPARPEFPLIAICVGRQHSLRSAVPALKDGRAACAVTAERWLTLRRSLLTHSIRRSFDDFHRGEDFLEARGLSKNHRRHVRISRPPRIKSSARTSLPTSWRRSRISSRRAKGLPDLSCVATPQETDPDDWKAVLDQAEQLLKSAQDKAAADALLVLGFLPPLTNDSQIKRFGEAIKAAESCFSNAALEGLPSMQLAQSLGELSEGELAGSAAVLLDIEREAAAFVAQLSNAERADRIRLWPGDAVLPDHAFTACPPALRGRARAFFESPTRGGTGLVIEIQGENSFRAVWGCLLSNFMKLCQKYQVS